MILEKFWLALITACRTDLVLKTLTGDSDSERHIGRQMPAGAARYPFLGLASDDETPAIPNSYTGYKRTVICFHCIADGQENEIKAIKIADRLDVLLHRDQEPQYKQYWNISNIDILNHWTRWIRRKTAMYDAKTTTWTIEVYAEFKWHMKAAQTI